MKSKNCIRKSSMIYVKIAIVTFVAILTGCQNEDVYNTTFTDLPFLSFCANNNYTLEELPDGELNVLTSAFQRINLIKKDGLYLMIETSANQINVSEGVFTCLINMVNISNKRILEDSKKSSSIPRLKSGTESGDGSSANDCVAQTVINIAQQMGKSLISSEVNSWIEQQYGTNGVPSGKITEVLNHFFNYSAVNISNGYKPPVGQQVFVVTKSDGVGHASRYLGCDGSSVLTTGGAFPLNDVVSSYVISGVK